ncbi:MAG: hypothetical protein ACFE9S_14525 [Candidatus Hermodarchaeota archaeon]
MSPICSQCGYNNMFRAKFCRKCGSAISEDVFEIKETLHKVITFSIVCVSLFIFLMIVANIGIFVEVGVIQGFIGMAIIWPLTIFLILWIAVYLRGGTRVRRFVISDDSIIIQIPFRDLFQISWSDFRSIEIVRRATWDMVSNTQTRFYNFIFKEDNVLKSFEIESGREFSRKALKQIRAKLEVLANIKGIEYTYFKKPPKKS